MKQIALIMKKNLIGPRLKAARQNAEPPVSQDQLAGKLARRKIALDRTAISRIESQERQVTDFELVAIAKSLRISVDYLLGNSKVYSHGLLTLHNFFYRIA